jgi:N-acylglucosamine 2-epimerase
VDPRHAALAKQYRSALLDDILPFWQRHSVDREQGGFFTCLDRDGSVYDTDKFVWLQARQVWLFAMLYRCLEQRPAWLDIARHGAEFLKRHGIDTAGNWYFSLDRSGAPLVQPYNVFSDCFAAMAFSAYGQATDDSEARAIAQRTFDNVLRRREDPKGRWSKAVPGSRPMKSLSLPMILANLCVELEWMLDPAVVRDTVDACIREVFAHFLDPALGVLRESVSPEGAALDCFEGRLVNPGHGIEAMWFLMDIAERRGDRQLIERAVETVIRTLAFGWDEKHGGIFYFMDRAHKPPQQLEWDQKLWWVHAETLVALAMGYRLSGSAECRRWFDRVHDYTWSHFPDQQHGEWFGYLNRRGDVLLPLKGGKWKGCFHVPRALYRCMRQWEKLGGA